MAIEKRLFAGLAGGIVLSVAASCMFTSCGGNGAENEKIDSLIRAQSRLNARVDSAKAVNEDLRRRLQDCNEQSDLMDEVVVKYEEYIENLSDSINMLKDSLNNTSTRLRECEDSKKPAQPAAKKPVAKKPAAKKPAAKKPAQKPVATTPCNPVVSAHTHEAAGADVVSANQNNGQTNVTIGCGANNNEVNVNNGTIINHNADTRPSYTRTITVEIERSRCR